MLARIHAGYAVSITELKRNPQALTKNIQAIKKFRKRQYQLPPAANVNILALVPTCTSGSHLARPSAVNLLLIDYFGPKPLKGCRDENFHDGIAERHESKSTIVTWNLDISEWPDVLPDCITGLTSWCWIEKAIDPLRWLPKHQKIGGKKRKITNPERG